MKYFFDTEFIEGFKKPISWLPTIGNFNKPYHSIQLISIGIVAEDGREYYAISNEYCYSDANDWVKQNVIAKIYQEQVSGFKQEFMDIQTFHKYIPEGKTNNQISAEIMGFVNPDLGWPTFSYNNSELREGGRLDDHFTKHNATAIDGYFFAQPEFYAYYADYDWVLFCSLFGNIMDLPKGFPMYCRDLKQSFDETVIATGFTAEALKKQTDYPKQQNEHNALDDAKWNFKLYQFLQTL